jgi:hypothetical protein
LLVDLGVSILNTVCQPEVLTVFRLAIAESDRAPEIARTLDRNGHEANQKALTELVRKAQSLGLISAGDPGALAACYIVVLWGDLLIRLLMRVRQAPTKREIEVRARAATETLLAENSVLLSALLHSKSVINKWSNVRADSKLVPKWDSGLKS